MTERRIGFNPIEATEHESLPESHPIADFRIVSGGLIELEQRVRGNEASSRIVLANCPGAAPIGMEWRLRNSGINTIVETHDGFELIILRNPDEHMRHGQLIRVKVLSPSSDTLLVDRYALSLGETYTGNRERVTVHVPIKDLVKSAIPDAFGGYRPYIDPDPITVESIADDPFHESNLGAGIQKKRLKKSLAALIRGGGPYVYEIKAWLQWLAERPELREELEEEISVMEEVIDCYQ